MTRWNTPAPYGAPAAVEAMASVAAPLLAGFSLALIGLVLPSQKLLRWPELALFLLVLSALLLLAAVQHGFWARQYIATPSDLSQWWPDLDESEERLLMVRREQWSYQTIYTVYAGRARAAYRLGILALLAAVAVVVVPDRPLGEVPAGRLAVVGLAVFGFLLEALWIIAAKPPRWLDRGPAASLLRAIAPRHVVQEPPPG